MPPPDFEAGHGPASFIDIVRALETLETMVTISLLQNNLHCQWRRSWGAEGAIAPPIIRVEGLGGAWRGMDGHGWGMAPEIQQILAIDYRKHPRF